MTRTEDRLRDALQASASRVRDDTLRPLASSARHGDPRTRSGLARWPAWAAPLAAAASVALVIGVIAVVAGYGRHGTSPGGPAGAVTGLPSFYASVDRWDNTDLNQVVVHATASGAVVASVPDPNMQGPAGSGNQPMPDGTPYPDKIFMEPDAVATYDDRTFYVVYEDQTQTMSTDYVIDSFRLSATGQVSALSRVAGGHLKGEREGGQSLAGFAVSPGNAKLALALSSEVPSRTAYPADEILVIDTRTGAHSLWRGGMDRPGAALGIQALSWAGDGRSLAYAATWCSPTRDALPDPGSFACFSWKNGQVAPHFAQIREIDTSAAGGSLSSGRVLLTQSARYPYLGQALISPDGSTLTAIVLTGPPASDGVGPAGPGHLAIVRISVATGAELSVLYQAHDPASVLSFLTADSSGQYVILGHAEGTAIPFGWIDAGHFRRLSQGDGLPSAW